MDMPLRAHEGASGFGHTPAAVLSGIVALLPNVRALGCVAAACKASHEAVELARERQFDLILIRLGEGIKRNTRFQFGSRPELLHTKFSKSIFYIFLRFSSFF